jgi:hypothetical protein
MSYETGAPPPPEHVPVPVQPVQLADTHDIGPARPARQYDATTAIIPGPPPGTTTYRLRATETTETTDPPTAG